MASRRTDASAGYLFLAPACLLLLVWGVGRLTPKIRDWLTQRVEEREASEARRFLAVRTACRANDPRAAREALARWMEAVQGGGEVGPLSGFARSRDLHELAAEIETLDAHLYGPGQTGWTGGALARAARQARESLRKAIRAHRQGDRAFGLSDLNPVC